MKAAKIKPTGSYIQQQINKLNRNTIYKLLSILLLLAGCRQDRFETFEAYTASTEELEILLSQVEPSTPSITFVLQGNGQVIPDTVLTTVEGVRVFVTDSESLFAREDGTPLALSQVQRLEITVSPAFSVGDLLAYNLMSKNTAIQWVNQLGTVRIEARYDGKTAQLRNDRQLRVQLPAKQLPLVADNAAATQLNSNDEWSLIPNSSTVYASMWPHQGNEIEGYELYISQLGWASVSLEIPSNSTINQFCLQAPLQFNGENTRAFLRLDDHTCLIPLEAATNGQFCANNLPTNQSATVFCFSKAGPNYWMASQQVTLSNDATSAQLTPQMAQYQDILAFAAQL
jgi:hypothetical protein